jgi:NitT/TauT family transport system substrate-binding protein
VKLSARVLSAAIAAVIVGSAAAGCSTGGTASGGTTGSMPIVTGLETTDLVVQDFPAIDSAGLYIAENEGLFKKEGLNVTVIPDYASSQDTVDKIESGKAQISSGDYVTYMTDLAGAAPAGSGDQNLEIVGEASLLEPNVLALMAGPNSKIKNLKQLEGKKIPISGSKDIGNLLVDSVLTDNNVPINTIHFVDGQNLTKVPFDIAQGKFPSGPAPEPFVTLGEQLVGDTVLADVDQGSTTNFPIQGYAVTREWAQQNPGTLKAFVTALDEGQEIADTNRAELQDAIEGQPLKVAANIAGVISLPDFPVGVDPTRLQRVMNDMIQFGFFTTKQTLATAKAFKVQNVVYAPNLANASGGSDLLGS